MIHTLPALFLAQSASSFSFFFFSFNVLPGPMHRWRPCRSRFGFSASLRQCTVPWPAAKCSPRTCAATSAITRYGNEGLRSLSNSSTSSSNSSSSCMSSSNNQELKSRVKAATTVQMQAKQFRTLCSERDVFVVFAL